MKGLSVVGIGSTTFGKHKTKTIIDLAKQAAEKAIFDAGIDRKQIGALYIGNFISGPLNGQEVLAGIIAEALGLGEVAATKVEGACASGGIAFRHACIAVASGLTEYALAIGVEKMAHASGKEVTSALNFALDKDTDGKAGLTFPSLYGMAWNSHSKKYGTTRSHVSAVVKKNKCAGLKNPLAQMGRNLTDNEILNSRLIAAPIRLFDCCPVSDGAAAAIITTNKNAKRAKTPISVLASVQTSGTPRVSSSNDLASFAASISASNQAFQMAGISRKDISLVELHDCFSIAEIIDIEDLGLIKRGEAGPWTAEGRTNIHGDVPINPSGGLISKGHPVGATGVGQIYEVCKQLRGEHPNQVPDAKIGLTHNLGGCGIACTISILANPNA